MTLPRAGIFGSARVAAGGGGPATATFQQSAVDATNASTYTFTAQPIGSASSTRRVVAAIAWRTGATTLALSSVTIGGVSATVEVTTTTQGNGVAIASAVVPTGTTADVVVALPEVAARCGVGVWTLTSGSPTGQSSSGSSSLTTTTVSGDIVIAVAATNSAGATFTWSGGTERYDEVVESGFDQSGADTTASTTSTVITFTPSAGTTQRGVAAAYA